MAGSLVQLYFWVLSSSFPLHPILLLMGPNQVQLGDKFQTLSWHPSQQVFSLSSSYIENLDLLKCSLSPMWISFYVLYFMTQWDTLTLEKGDLFWVSPLCTQVYLSSFLIKGPSTSYYWIKINWRLFFLQPNRTNHELSFLQKILESSIWRICKPAGMV